MWTSYETNQTANDRNYHVLFDVSNVCAQEQLLCSDGLTDMVRYLCFIHQLGCSTSGSWNKQWSVRFVWCTYSWFIPCEGSSGDSFFTFNGWPIWGGQSFVHVPPTIFLIPGTNTCCVWTEHLILAAWFLEQIFPAQRLLVQVNWCQDCRAFFWIRYCVIYHRSKISKRTQYWQMPKCVTLTAV